MLRQIVCFACISELLVHKMLEYTKITHF
ncbi:hypothetical protein E2C01_032754 [Portunus trituberculatus]|uniref:Uncharacterized protein n=1 Tax=Portunus trituberculatus TaxID=210409 RepID=A0A5B7F1K3_PORTR|nr:hypothetical protein [Portunus trituberculatus]